MVGKEAGPKAPPPFTERHYQGGSLFIHSGPHSQGTKDFGDRAGNNLCSEMKGKDRKKRDAGKKNCRHYRC